MGFLTAKIHFKPKGDEERLIKLLTHISKNIYNVALYELRQYYFKTQRVLPLDALLDKIKDNENVIALGSDWSAAIAKDARKNLYTYTKYHNFDGTVKAFMKDEMDKEKFSAAFPRYLKKKAFHSISMKGLKKDRNGEYLNVPLPPMIASGRVFKMDIKDELLKEFVDACGPISNPTLKIKVPRYVSDRSLPLAIIVPDRYGEYFTASILYPYNLPMPKKIDYKRVMGIDIGVNNLLTCATTTSDAFIIRGKELKSLNRLYNRVISKEKKRLPFIDGDKERQLKTSKHIRRLYRNMNDKIDAYINSAAKMVIDYALKNNINLIIIGWNNGIKTGGVKNDELSNFTKAKINESFVGLPLSELKDRIVLKGKMVGITVEVINEANTSEKSFFDNDSFKSSIKSGKRIERGDYITAKGLHVNADYNAALNMIRKYFSIKGLRLPILDKLVQLGPLVPYGIKIKLS